MIHSWSDYDREKPKYSARNLSQFYFAHHIMRMGCHFTSCYLPCILVHAVVHVQFYVYTTTRCTRCYSVDIVTVDLFKAFCSYSDTTMSAVWFEVCWCSAV